MNGRLLSAAAIRRVLEERFDREELEQLCADLQESLAQAGIGERVSLDAAGGESYPNQVLRLVAFIERREWLHFLAAEIEKVRPGALGDGGIDRPAPQPPGPPAPTKVDGLILMALVITMCIVIVLVGAVVCALVWAQIVGPIFLNLTLALVIVPALVLVKWRQPRAMLV